MKRQIRQFLLVACFTYLLIELMCFICIRTLYTQARLPRFFNDPRDTLVFPFTYADINPHWGVWHYPDPRKTPYGCLTIECAPNSTGARDREREKDAGNTGRCIVLGDSFMEGFGIAENKRVSNLLEKRTGREFLNFACADMGSTQEYLVYKHLAASFDHNSILIGILPANDFLNDNKTFDSLQSPLRYKPYWTGTYPEMRIEYHTTDLASSQFTEEAFAKLKGTFRYRVRYFLENTTCWFNLLYYMLKKQDAAAFVRTRTEGGQPYSGYYDYSEDDLLRLQQSLLGIKKIADAAPASTAEISTQPPAPAGKKIVLLTIPVAADFARYAEKKSIPPLPPALSAFCAAQDITYIDLLSAASQQEAKEYPAFYFDCDLHWNERGNVWAYEKLLPYFTAPAAD